jgi:hypothetical protein
MTMSDSAPPNLILRHGSGCTIYSPHVRQDVHTVVFCTHLVRKGLVIQDVHSLYARHDVHMVVFAHTRYKTGWSLFKLQHPLCTSFTSNVYRSLHFPVISDLQQLLDWRQLCTLNPINDIRHDWIIRWIS